MALVISTQATVAIPVNVSTVILAQNLTRLGFYIECEELNTDWWVTFLALAAAENEGLKRSGRARLSSEEVLPTQAGTNAFVEPVRVFVKARSGITAVNFWVIEWS